MIAVGEVVVCPLAHLHRILRPLLYGLIQLLKLSPVKQAFRILIPELLHQCVLLYHFFLRFHLFYDQALLEYSILKLYLLHLLNLPTKLRINCHKLVNHLRNPCLHRIFLYLHLPRHHLALELLIAKNLFLGIDICLLLFQLLFQLGEFLLDGDGLQLQIVQI